MRGQRAWGAGTAASAAIICVVALLVGPALAALDADHSGGIDRTFADNGHAVIGFGHQPTSKLFIYEPPRDIAVGRDGKLAVAGWSSWQGSVTVTVVTPGGRPDVGFSTDGQAQLVPGPNDVETNGVAFGPRRSVLAAVSTRDRDRRCTRAGIVVGFRENGSVDPAFGHRGASEAIACAVLSRIVVAEGRILVAGVLRRDEIDPRGRAGPFVARYHFDGRLDRSFGGGDGVAAVPRSDERRNALPPRSLGLTRDGKVFTVGPFGADRAPTVVRLNRDGTVDRAYADNGVLDLSSPAFRDPPFRYVMDMEVRADGSLLVLGGTGDPILAAIDSAGRPDNAFGSGGSVGAPDSPRSLYIARGGDILALGEQLARYAPTGDIRTGFGKNGYRSLPWRDRANHVVAVPAGRIIVAADRRSYVRDASPTGFELRAFDAAGGRARGFGRNGVVRATTKTPSWDSPSFVASLPGGRVLAVGRAGPDLALTGLTQRGRLDRSFGKDGRVRPNISAFFPITALQGSKILSENGDEPHHRLSVSRFHANGSIDLSFGREGTLLVKTPTDRGVAGIAVFPDRSFAVAAETFRQRTFVIARFKPNGRLDRAFGGGNGFIKRELGLTESLNVIGLDPLPEGGILMTARKPRLRFVRGDRPDRVGTDTAVLAFGAHGGPMRGFGRDGMVILRDLNPTDAAVTPGGRLTIVGSHCGADDMYSLRCTSGGEAQRLRASGRLDRSFGGDGMVSLGRLRRPYALAMEKGGGFVAAGPGRRGFVVSQREPEGALDRSFGRRGTIATEYGMGRAVPTAVDIGQGGRLVVAGSGNFRSGGREFVLVRYRLR